MSRSYKDHKIHSCSALNHPVSKLNLDLYQDGLESPPITLGDLKPR